MKNPIGNVVKLVLVIALMFGVRLLGGEAAVAVATVTPDFAETKKKADQRDASAPDSRLIF